MEKLHYLGKNIWGNKFYYMNVMDDSFVHFTTLSRAKDIVDSKKLLLDSPHTGFGAYGTFAVSLTFGKYVPAVQTSHMEKSHTPEDPIVAVKFKTNTVPSRLSDVGEVAFGEKDVNLINPEIISKEKAISLIKSSTEDIHDEEKYNQVIYDKSIIPNLNIVSKEASHNTLKRYFGYFFE